jgi:hypothetical protein
MRRAVERRGPGFTPARLLSVGQGFSPARLVVLAFALPLVVTASTLAQVAWNRTVVRGPIVLTEREIHVSRASDDNSARRGWISWQQRVSERDWIRRDALASLGFDMSVDAASADAARHYGRMLPKQAWVAFELGGRAFDALRAEARERGSRLVPIDVSDDSHALVQQYPDAGRYLITAAIVRASWQDPPDAAPYVTVGIFAVAPKALHIPLGFAPAVAGERYRVSVVYGRRFEPWIVAASR